MTTSHFNHVIKKEALEIGPGFIYKLYGHTVACGDSTDEEFLRRVLTSDGKVVMSSMALLDPPYRISSDAVIKLPNHKDMFLNETWDRLPEAEYKVFLDKLISVIGKYTLGNIFCWCSDWYLSDVKRALSAAGFQSKVSYVWCKSNPPRSIRKRSFVSACEFAAVGMKPGAYFDLDEMPKQRNYFVSTSEGEFLPAVTPWWVERGLVANSERLKRENSTEFLNRGQKPLDLTKALLGAMCPPGDRVIDPVGGTGTTLVAADRAGVACIYIDRDPVQVRAAAKRLIADRRKRG